MQKQFNLHPRRNGTKRDADPTLMAIFRNSWQLLALDGTASGTVSDETGIRRPGVTIL